MSGTTVDTASTSTAVEYYKLPSIHSKPPFFTLQPNPVSKASQLENWSRLVLSYARYHRLFHLRIEDVKDPLTSWREVLVNERINRRVSEALLSDLLADMVFKGVAAYEPPKQARAVLLYWRHPEEWAEVLHSWAVSTGHLNTILTYYEIIEPAVPSPLESIPIPLLKQAINVLAKTHRAQVIGSAEGDGVRFFPSR